MSATAILQEQLTRYSPIIHNVVNFYPGIDRVVALNLTAANTGLNALILADVEAFSQWIDQQLASTGARYGVGGYMENRTIYSRRQHFDNADEPRSLHLGVDIWAAAGTPVHAPLAGIIHSFQDNKGDGDYGPTIILQHQLGDVVFYSLYGHLDQASLNGLYTGKAIAGGEQIAAFGPPPENGNWPTHLHFQLMLDMEGRAGDYPGVCKPSEKETYLQNIPDAGLLLPF